LFIVFLEFVVFIEFRKLGGWEARKLGCCYWLLAVSHPRILICWEAIMLGSWNAAIGYKPSATLELEPSLAF
jgi:hypothetical protein